MQFGSILGTCEDLVASLKWRDDIKGWDVKEIQREAAYAVKEIDECKDKLARFNYSLSQLTAEQVGLLLVVEAIISIIRAQAERSDYAAQMMASAPSITKVKLAELEASLGHQLEDLAKQLEALAPGWSVESS